MRSAPIVWPAQAHEAAAIARLLVEFRDWHKRDWPSANAFLAGVERLIERPGTEFLLASPARGAPAAGVCQLRYRFSIWMAAEDCWLEDLYVSDSARGRGLGRLLAGAAVERARARGVRRIELDVNEANAEAVALYESVGFSAQSKAHDGKGRDLLMALQLGE